MKKLILGILIFWIYPVVAQKQWTLEECVNYAMENNLTIRLQQLNIELSELAVTRNKGAFLPSVSAGASHSYNYGRTVDMFTNEFATDRVQSNNFYLAGNITLFNGFSLINRWKESQLEAEATRLEAQQTADDISLAIATAYLQILYSREMVSNAEGQLSVTRLQLNRTEKLFQAGSVSKGALLTIEAQYASEESQLVSAQNQLDIAYLTLVQMLDLKDAAGFSVAIPAMTDIDTASFLLLNPSDVYSFAERNQPGIQAAEYRVQIADKNLDLARAGLFPVLTMSASFGTGYSGASKSITGMNVNGYDTVGITSESPAEFVLTPSYSYDYEVTSFNDQIKDNMNKSIGLSLTIPIFSRLATSTSISQARINADMAMLNYEQEKLNLQKTIQQAYADARAAYRQFVASRKQVDALKESFGYMQQRFDIGLANPVEYSDSKNKLITAESQLLQAKYEFIFRTKILDFYLGKEIKL